MPLSWLLRGPHLRVLALEKSLDLGRVPTTPEPDTSVLLHCTLLPTTNLSEGRTFAKASQYTWELCHNTFRMYPGQGLM